MKSHKQRLTYNYVKKVFEDNDCQLLSNEYKNARTHLEYICSCGNEAKIIFDSFRRGHRCRKCGFKKFAKSQTLDYSHVKEYIEKHGCKLMSEIYNKSIEKLEIQCSCGKIFERTFNNFCKKKKMCPDCALKSRSGENHYEWKKDRKAHREELRFRDRCHKMVTHALRYFCKTKKDHTIKLLGYTHKELRDYIKDHSNWKNIKDKRWHLDHIFPIKAFVDIGISDMKLINCLENLQPLSVYDNISKGKKYNKKDFVMWLKEKGVKIDENKQ